ncbi:MAG: hypothetical protein E7604_07340 [Ruminococcaceae bacterium]|nr:hypothetical protein [Oscillospiraceae bacterium]
MEHQFHGTRWLKEGFAFPSLTEYITQKKQELSAPLTVPEYAASWERIKIDQISDKLKTDPYLNRALFHEGIKHLMQSIGKTQALRYRENPLLYDVCTFVVGQLIHGIPMILLYEAPADSGNLYNASVLSYQEQIFIFVSAQFFREFGMLNEEELCFMIAHEVGHAHCHHTHMNLETDEKTSDYEYSADRAGVLACTALILKKHPDYTVEEAARQAVLYASSTLTKLYIAVKNGPGCTDWSGFDYDEMQSIIDSIYDHASQYTVSRESHPHTPHRIMAMDHFRNSHMLYRCLGLPIPHTDGLNSDEQLAKYMAFIMNDYAKTRKKN